MPFDTSVRDKAIARRSEHLEGERQRLLAQTCALLESLCSRFGIRSAYVFGTLARPRRFHERSDVDIAVETSRPKLLTEAIGRFSLLLDRDVDLVDLATVPFADRIRREGIQWTPKSS
ncbi:MAG: nucleotidyltransferase domain-containing protein [Caldilineaceae bacterium]|nr:nucleotidyltransferase domain-containing protein [Caldilineaceae bacterium]